MQRANGHAEKDVFRKQRNRSEIFAGGILDGTSETPHLGTIIDVGGRDVQSQ